MNVFSFFHKVGDRETTSIYIHVDNRTETYLKDSDTVYESASTRLKNQQRKKQFNCLELGQGLSALIRPGFPAGLVRVRPETVRLRPCEPSHQNLSELSQNLPDLGQSTTRSGPGQSSARDCQESAMSLFQEDPVTALS